MMAIFATSGEVLSGRVFDNSPGLNAYFFFEHSFIYSQNGVFGSLEYTSTYSPTLINGFAQPSPNPGLSTNYQDRLSGTGLTAHTAGTFALTGGTVSGFETGYSSSGFLLSAHETASGFSIAATTFWNLASTGQWHALWQLATVGDDTMTGSNVAANADFIEGGAGSDTINARAGDDNVWGNAGRDFLFGGDGNDVVVCNDWQTPANADLWSEGHGDAGNDYIFTGGYGHGFLDGGTGEDRMWGGPQADFLNGGEGIDYMAGGAGGDVFEVSAAGNIAGQYDFILDFQDGVDFIKLQAGAAWTVTDSAYGAIISAPVTGFYIIVQYATAATVSDQIYYA
jgi:Ca2+-binding RTX toxin-like protein